MGPIPFSLVRRKTAGAFCVAVLVAAQPAYAGEEDGGVGTTPTPPASATATPARPESDERLIFSVPVLHTLGLFTLQRVAESILFPKPFSEFEDWGAHYEEAFTKPPLFDSRERAFQWDHDHWTTNLLGHGLMGSELYLRARHCHFGWAGSLLFTTSASVVWEYGFEANGVRPSAQDLIYTPLMGMALGELRYFVWKSAGGSTKNVVRAIFDPFGELERALGTPC